MTGRSETSAPSETARVNLYPYNPIMLKLKDLLPRFGSRLGIDYVPIVMDWGMKNPLYKRWQAMSFEELCQLWDGKYLDALTQKTGDHNIGIRLGPAHGRLATFDIDTEDRRVIDQLLDWNPFLKETLWTRGATGCQIWFRLRDPYPAVWRQLIVPEVRGKKREAAVELRAANGLQSVIWGLHPSGRRYSVVNDYPVQEVAFA